MRLLFLMLACFGVLYGYADQGKEKREKIPFKSEHEVFFGVGAIPFPANHEEEESYNEWDYSLVHFNGDIYHGPKYTSGAYFIGYSYRMRSWLNLCFSTSYSAYWRKFYEYYTRIEHGKEYTHYLGFAPAVRLTWLNRKYVRMYSTLGVGITFKWYKNENISSTNCKILAIPEVSVIGISVGKTWYGFAEAGPSHHGSFNMGIGYRFNIGNNKK